MSSEVIELLQTLIRNACVNTGSVDGGDEYRSVATLQDFFGVQGQVFEPKPGRQSLVYRVKGTDPSAPSLALVPHLDVVPVDASGWTQDPFGADIIDGFVYGRGAVDMLNMVAAFAVAIHPYVRGEIQPRGDLVFAAVADEEAGGSHGSYPLVKNHWDLVGADFLLTEVAYPSVGTSTAIPVAIGEKGSYFSRLKTTGMPAHGSVPYASDNALNKMVGALHGLVASPSPVVIGEQWVQFVDGIEMESGLAEALKDPKRIDQAIDTIARDDPGLAGYIHAVTHLTVSPNQMQAGMKSNIVADKASTVLDIRSLPDMDRKIVERHLRNAMGRPGEVVEIVRVGNNPASISPTETALWRAIASSVQNLEGHSNLVPALMPVATDGRYWRRKGTAAYGVGLYDNETTFSDLLSRFHGHDERISVESVERSTALYEQILANLGQA